MIVNRAALGLSIVLLGWLLTQCTSDKAPLPNGGGSGSVCDTIPVSYSNDIVPLLTDHNCFACHVSTNPVFNDYASVYANRNTIFGAIEHSPGFDPMPQGQPQLADSLRQKFECWLEQGAPDN